MPQESLQKPFSLESKVVVIIGAAGLVGAEFAKACARAGATVVASDVNAQKGESLIQEIQVLGGNAVFLPCDTLDPASVKALGVELFKRFKKVDGVVNAAYPRTPAWGTRFTELSYGDFLKHIEMQVGPSFLSAREFGEIMAVQGFGSIVLVGSIYGVKAPHFEMYKDTNINPTPVEYAIAKGGLVLLTQYLAKYYGPKGVRVNMLSPGGVWNNHLEEFEKNFGVHVPLGGHMQRKEDLGATLVYLFAEASRQVTGQNLVIDGGWTL